MSKNNNVGKNGKEFAPSFGFWPAKSGNGFTVQVTPELVATLQKAVAGTTMYLTFTPNDKLEQNERLPHIRVSILPPREQQQNEESL